MKTKRQLWRTLLAAIVIGVGTPGVSGIGAAQTAASSDDVEVMTRGPVHEAFAETVVFDPKPGIIVSTQPPALIEEVQPDQRPVGDNVAWIPGYWAWDEDQKDFPWISGVWRNLPPGREWIPGYWSQVNTGYQWTSGYWQDAETKEVSYLQKPPPRSLETGPSVPASANDQTWLPGSWEYRDDRYAWRPGYWVTARANWAWTPSYYRWTHRGYVYVDGYWDYPVVSRGVIFAPVRFHRTYEAGSNYYYSPTTVISLSVFTNHLFVRPSYCHYYFGDYYDSGYHDRYYASHAYGSRYRGGYEPIYAHYRWENRRDQTWDRQRQDDFEYRRDNVSARPPRTWAALNQLPDRDRERGEFRVAERYDRVVGSRDDDRRRFQAVSSDERQRFVSQRNEIRNFSRERQEREVSTGRATGDQASRVKVNRSPVASRREVLAENAGGPPARPQKRTSEREAAAANKRGSSGTPNAGRNAPDEATADSARTQKPSRNEAQTNRETRTKPGQRRDAQPNARPADRQEANSRTTPSAESKDKAETRRAAVIPTERNQEKPSARSINKLTAEKRAATPDVQRQEVPAPKRQASPQVQRKSTQPEAKIQSSRQEAERRNAAAAPISRSTPKAAPQPRVQQKPQPKAQPERQQAPRPQTRIAKPDPQQQKAKPTPQRQAASQAQPRQAARSAPQAQRSAPKQQAKSADQKAEERKKRKE
ncbi:MAG: hypothetical protein ACRCXD_05095 [Luteolibacter sp.]